MRMIARELNLSESTFITDHKKGAYEMRIFTPAEELPFAGHPTLGSAWMLRRLGLVKSDHLIQTTSAGQTLVTISDEIAWFERRGSVVEEAISARTVGDVLGIDRHLVAPRAWDFDAGMLWAAPAISDAGMPQLLVPVADVDALVAIKPSEAMASLAGDGLYCWTIVGSHQIKARFFALSLGVREDPATGSAAAALGVYIASQLGDV